MSLQEKAAQLRYVNYKSLIPEDRRLEAVDEIGELQDQLAAGLGHIFHNSNSAPNVVAHNVRVIQQFARRKTRLGIPLFVHTESLHGLMGRGTTVFPQATALASTWDRDLVERVFTIVAKEARSRGIHITYAPVLDITTDARWGRSQETYGEDPYLNGEIGLACVRGYQGREFRDGTTTIAEDRIISCAKHFAGYGQGEGGRNFGPSRIPRREMRNKVLRPFRKAVTEGGLMAMMAAHQEIDGVPCHMNRELLTETLRDEWGFKGLVISDADDIYRLYSFHRVAEDMDAATLLGLRAGIDIEILRSHCYDELERLVTEGTLKESELDATLARVLRVKFEMGLFEDKGPADPDAAVRIGFCGEHRKVSKEAADKGIILLENRNGLLPLNPAKIKRIAVIGPDADPVQFGSYSPNSAEGVSVVEGLREKCTPLGIEVAYAKGCAITTVESDDYETELDFKKATANPELVSDEANRTLIDEAMKTAAGADVAVVCVGSNHFTSREAVFMQDHRGDRDRVDLPGSQSLLIREVAGTGTPVVVVMFNGRPMSTADVIGHIQALFCAWALGCETGRTVADVLFGDVNPSGKLTVSLPIHVGQIPVHYNQPPSGMFRNYLFSDNKPQYPFGYGLSYTTFTYNNLRLEPDEISAGGSTRATVEVTNTGDRSGDEIVQLYIRDDFSTVTRPVLELAGFERVHLSPAETRRVTFDLTPEALGLYGLDYTFTVEPGTFTIYAGPHSQELLETTLRVT